MSFIVEVIADGFRSLFSFGTDVRDVVVLTLVVSVTATLIASVIGIPLGVALSTARFRGRQLVMTLVNVGMGIPPVLAGLLVLLLLWGEGPFGSFDLLFTPTAMVMVQVVLALPIAIGVTVAAVSNVPREALEQLRALDLPRFERGRLLAVEARAGVFGAVAAAFGRVISEVGAVLIVGGNIAGETRVLTTAIVQESRQARFGAAVALGVVLLALSVIVNGGLTWLQAWGESDG